MIDLLSPFDFPDVAGEEGAYHLLDVVDPKRSGYVCDGGFLCIQLFGVVFVLLSVTWPNSVLNSPCLFIF